ncbi:hypothetical protein D1007_43513 [Hordeum vulgare]|nr:hypothetical protein D1007_43513 [Hordeum vulgare]
MLANKDSREEKRRQEKEEQVRASMEIQNKKLAFEAEKQANMLEIEAIKVATNAREARLACMMKGFEIMRMDLNMVSLRKRSWFEKMQTDIFSLEDE